MILLLEWTGCITGVLGSFLLATNGRWSGYGFVLFLASNMAWIGYGMLTGAYGMITMQLAFTLTSALGVWRWLVQPWLKEARRREVWHG